MPYEKVSTPRDILSLIDYTLLKADASVEQIRALCQKAIQYGTATVCVHGCYVPVVAAELQGSGVKTASVAGFPFGAQPTEVKVFEAEYAIRAGAQEIDMVMNIGAVKSGDWQTVLSDIRRVRAACSGKALLKVILETCLLTEEEKVHACTVCVEAGADFVKTSTGLSTGGATVEDVALMRKTVGNSAEVKAAGGIRDLKTLLAMVDAGASRIGTSTVEEIAREAYAAYPEGKN